MLASRLRAVVSSACVLFACLLSAGLWQAGLAIAQPAPAPAASRGGAGAYPSRPITLIVPYAPGNTDVLARVYLNQMAQNTQWTFTYDYKPGVAGRIGTAAAARAAPDGYTLLMISATVTYGHMLKTRLPYDWRRDLAPVFPLNRTTGILLVHPSLPAKTLAEYIAYGKANPGRINYGTVGTGGIVHLIAEYMHNMMGIKVTYVPYKGYGPITTALVAGDVQAAHPTYKAFQAMIQAGKVRPLAFTAAHARLPQLPGVRSMAEEGLPGFDNFSWVGIFVPSGTPGPIVNRLNAEFNRARQSEDVVKRLDDIGETPGEGSPEDFRKFLMATSERLEKIIRETGIELEE